MSKSDILTRLAREAAEAYYPGRDEPRRTLLDAATLITSLLEALAKAREALASELDNRGEEFDDAYAVPVAPVIKAIDALNPSRKETGI